MFPSPIVSLSCIRFFILLSPYFFIISLKVFFFHSLFIYFICCYSFCSWSLLYHFAFSVSSFFHLLFYSFFILFTFLVIIVSFRFSVSPFIHYSLFFICCFISSLSSYVLVLVSSFFLAYRFVFPYPLLFISSHLSLLFFL